MPAIPITRRTGIRSWEVVENVVGGQLCESRTQSRIGVAGAGSLHVLGVAVDDAVPVANFQSGTNGRPLLNTAPVPNRAGLAYSGDEAPVKYAAPAAFGDKLKAAANGAVTPMSSSDDFRLWVGTCTEGAGVLANAVGLMRIA